MPAARSVTAVAWRKVTTFPWMVDVLFGAKLMLWGAVNLINPETLETARAWHSISSSTHSVLLLCAVAGSIQVVAGYSRLRKYRIPAAWLCLWVSWGLTAANSHHASQVSHGMDGLGEMLILLGVLQ